LLARITEFLVNFGPWGIMLASFLDSAGIPLAVGVDALVILLTVNRPELAVWWVALAVLSSCAGNIVLFYVARKGGQKLLSAQESGRRRRFRQWFHRYGLVTVFIPALVPIPMPLKFFVVCAAVLATPLWQFLATIALARVIRFGSEAYLAVRMGEQSTAYLVQNRWRLAAFAALLGIALYLLVKFSERWRASGSPNR
jgi:membrane protein YqaA with SNARE-associated domain